MKRFAILIMVLLFSVNAYAARLTVSEASPQSTNRQFLTIYDATSITADTTTGHFKTDNITGLIVAVKATSSAGTPAYTFSIQTSVDETEANFTDIIELVDPQFTEVTDENWHVYHVNGYNFHEFTRFNIALGAGDGGDDEFTVEVDLLYGNFTHLAKTQPVGTVLSDGTDDSSAPIKVGGVARDPASLPAAVQAGDRVDAMYDLYGRQVVILGSQIAGEDLTNDVLKIEHQYSYQAVATSDTQVKASAGFLHTVTISCNDAAPTAGSLIIYDNTAESGTQVFNHTFTTTPFVPFTLTFDAVMTTGIYLGFTTTADVNVSVSYR